MADAKDFHLVSSDALAFQKCSGVLQQTIFTVLTHCNCICDSLQLAAECRFPGRPVLLAATGTAGRHLPADGGAVQLHVQLMHMPRETGWLALPVLVL